MGEVRLENGKRNHRQPETAARAAPAKKRRRSPSLSAPFRLPHTAQIATPKPGTGVHLRNPGLITSACAWPRSSERRPWIGKRDAALLTLRGEIDVYTAPRLRQAIIDLVDGGATRIVVDMEKVDFLDSTGLGVLVGGLKRVRMKDGSLAVVTTQDKILKIFDITGLNKVFAIHPSVEEAASA